MLTNNLFKRWTYKFFAPDLLQRGTYEAFRRLLEHDRRCHELIADFQDLFFKKKEPTEWTQVTALYDQLSEAVGAITRELTLISSREATDLATYYKKFDSYIRFLLQPESNRTGPPYIICLGEPGMTAQLGGNKARNLAEIYQNFDCSVPPGFAVTTNSWNSLVAYNDLRPAINAHLRTLDLEDNQSLLDTSKALISLIMGADIPPEIHQAIEDASHDLVTGLAAKTETRFAVRSSAVSEDGLNSFAGQYRSILNVAPEDVHHSYLQVLASKYTPSAMLYRITAGISDTEASMAVLIIEMIKARAAGVIYTTDPKGEKQNTLFIHSVQGGGEKLVGGKARPHLSSFNKKELSPVKESGSKCPIDQGEAKKLARLATGLEEFFGAPQDIEWAIGDEEPVILQSRPLKTIIPIQDADPENKVDKPDLPLLYHGGITAAQGRGTGVACFLSASPNPQDLPADAVLIVENIPASLIIFLSRCRAVISTMGSSASHFSTICRELGVPLIVEATDIKEKITHGEMITVDADSQNIYLGRSEESSTAAGRPLSSRKNHPYFLRLQTILDFITPLNILDPEANSFVPESCRSFHDIVRFAHEKSVRAMFAIGKSGSRRGHRKRLETALPFDLYLITVDDNVQDKKTADDDTITIDQVESIPFRALWQGLTHPSIEWGDREYYNWKEYDSAAMTDGFAFKNKTESASYAVCGHDYLNLNIRFGYHFTIVDTLCGESSEQNYCSIRFAGGGGTIEGRFFRLKYLEEILSRIGFQVTSKTDLLDARLEGLNIERMTKCLVTLGRMLGTSKLMDMMLKDEESVASHLDLFFQLDDTLLSGREQAQ